MQALSIPTDLIILIESFCNWRPRALLALAIDSADFKWSGDYHRIIYSVRHRAQFTDTASKKLYKVWKYGGYFENSGHAILSKESITWLMKLVHDESLKYNINQLEVTNLI